MYFSKRVSNGFNLSDHFECHLKWFDARAKIKWREKILGKTCNTYGVKVVDVEVKSRVEVLE